MVEERQTVSIQAGAMFAAPVRQIDDFLPPVGIPPDVVISVCDNAADQCPVFPGGGVQRLHWPFDDPADATGTDDQKREVFRRVRDEIRETILEWVA